MKGKLNLETMINLYFELLKHPIFTIEDVNRYYGKVETARSAVKRLMAKGLAMKIRNNLYTCISGETDSPVASRYQVACALTPTAYLSHHTAMEYYGVSDQVFYEVYVSSQTAFNKFEFDGTLFRCILAKCSQGIETIQYSGGLRITDRERTVIDSIKDMDRIAGMEEVLANIGGLSLLDDRKLLEYLECYNKQFLYQKTGFLLRGYQQQLGLSAAFFEACMSRIGLSKRYLTKDCQEGKYDAEWHLVIPMYVYNLKNGG